MRFSWTPAHVKTLTRLWEQNISIKDIAAKLGTSYESVESKRRRLMLTPHVPLSPLQAQRYQRTPADAAEAAWPPKRELRTCRWPIGHPHEKNFHFCGVAVSDSKPYCPEHLQAAYQRPTRKVLAKAGAHA